MAVCKNCVHCNITTDKEYCKRVKCTATKRGRTITWSMCCVDGNGTPVNVFQRFADYLEKHSAPNWCPLNAGINCMAGRK